MKKKPLPKLTYKPDKDVSSEVAQLRLNTAFDILFDEVLKRRNDRQASTLEDISPEA